MPLEQLANLFPLATQSLQDAAVTTVKTAVRPHCRVYNDASIATSSGLVGILTFNQERWDLGTTTEQHSTSSNTQRLTCRVAGLYEICAHVAWQASVGGDRRIVNIRLNGTTNIAGDERNDTAAAGNPRCSVTTQYRLAVDDYVEVTVVQDSGGALNVISALNESPEFSFCWLSN